METGGCECPCECLMLSQACSPSPLMSLTLNHQNKFSTSRTGNNNSMHNEEESLMAHSSCPVTPEVPAPLHYGVGLLTQLNECQATQCGEFTNMYSCMGVLDCVWCSLESDARTPLENPFCAHAHKCYGGVRGGPSPYPPGLAPLPRSEERGSVLPILPGRYWVFLVYKR